MAKGFAQFAPLLAICLIFPVLSVRSAKEPGAVEALWQITLVRMKKLRLEPYMLQFLSVITEKNFPFH